MNPYLITGGSSGVGLTVAKRLVARGATVIIVGRSADKLGKAMAELDAINYRHARILQAHIAGLVEFESAVRQLGPLSGAFHAAGQAIIRPIRASSNLAGLDPAVGLISLARAGQFENGSSIVAMSSVAAHRGVAFMSEYSAGKAAVEGAVRSLAVELAPRKIRVNAIAAGAFKSPMHEKITAEMDDEGVKEYEREHPLGFGTEEDVANVAMFLLDYNESKWVTGAIWAVDGGAGARW